MSFNRAKVVILFLRVYTTPADPIEIARLAQ